MANWEDIVKANQSIGTMDIKGKEYALVNQRVKAFRMVYPGGGIVTELLSNEDGMCVFKATCIDENGTVLGTGTAYEKESSSYINKTSYIENCETSAVGRALGFAGFGIDTSIASYEEVDTAIHQQEQKKEQQYADAEHVAYIVTQTTPEQLDKVMKTYGLKNIEDISPEQAAKTIRAINKRKAEENEH